MFCIYRPGVRVMSHERAVVIGVGWGWVGGCWVESAVYGTGLWPLFVAVLVYYFTSFLVISQRYRLRPAPSSHWGHWTLIHISGTQEPWIQIWVARMRVMIKLLRTYPHFRESGYCHFVVRQPGSHFSVVSASTPGRTLTDDMNGEKFRRCWRQDSIYFRRIKMDYQNQTPPIKNGHETKQNKFPT